MDETNIKISYGNLIEYIIQFSKNNPEISFNQLLESLKNNDYLINAFSHDKDETKKISTKEDNSQDKSQSIQIMTPAVNKESLVSLSNNEDEVKKIQLSTPPIPRNNYPTAVLIDASTNSLEDGDKNEDWFEHYQKTSEFLDLSEENKKRLENASKIYDREHIEQAFADNFGVFLNLQALGVLKKIKTQV